MSFKKLVADVHWRVGHQAPENRFQIEVNLNSARINLEDLYVPEVKGPNEGAAQEERRGIRV